ncbi:helix-turn-helix domain-containing protein [Leptospira interrogans]|uniref:helix-turn-helix domain-containing protein n=1 Tax=Leptospira interrogans TaxID=173 RepID=UPI0002BAB002|nr:helix-turn-helix domain-containing protein [Leptospira interrogans]MCR8649618.1 AraC family transcriptional regulator [Leptospira interrogans serovar Bataviae]OAM85885.1 AraC family transcriptional regulator [Leptospira interrogans serovar Bataviae]QOI40829.1 AraC family transcriptional regulator [Leptospira interrogans serovar Bataviae]QYY62645.1 helix-turn-helix domain-containing protein [Leptospira interrogans serovar Bataviae]
MSKFLSIFDIYTVGILDYENFLKLGIIYFHAFGVVIGFLLGFSKLYSSDGFSKSYGSILQSAAFFLILNNGILIDQGILRYDSRILFGSYYGLVLYSSLAVIVCFNYLFESLDNPWIYCKRLLGIIPITILFSYFIPVYYFISFIDILGIVISIFTFVWSLKKVLNTKKSILYFNLPFLSLLISICFVFDFIGTIYDKKNLLFFAEFIPGSVICYSILLERFFPSLFGKVIVSIPTNLVKEIELETIPIPEVKEAETYKYQSKELLVGIDLEKVNTKLNHFIDIKGFKEEEIRLPDFAAALGLTVHRASKYLNVYLNTSFTDFLNYHRMIEVIIYMEKKTDFNLLNIALECGFNSASSFHRACVKFTGKSPKELKSYIQSNEGSSLSILKKPKIQSHS